MKRIIASACVTAATAIAWLCIMPPVCAVAAIAWLAEGLEDE